MTTSIQNYVNTKQLENTLVTGLMEKLTYLLAIRDEMLMEVTQIDEMIDDIVSEMQAAGINVK